MNLAKVERGICINIISCDDIEFGKTLGYEIEVPNDFGIGDLYQDGIWKKKVILPPKEPPKLILNEEELNKEKQSCQNYNKTQLDLFLQKQSILWNDNKKYGVSKEDQVEISLLLTKNQIKKTQEPLMWHAKGEKSRPFSEKELNELFVAILNFVEPYCRHQEKIKEQILNAKSLEELYELEINYGNIK